MLRSALWKDTLREMIKTPGRFLSIFAITAIGVGFFSGVRATGDDMRLTADDYFDSARLADLRIVSTLGLTEADADALKTLDGVEAVMPSQFVDLVGLSADNFVVRAISLPHTEAGEPLNQLRLISGRFPTSPEECVIDSRFLMETDFDVGRTISFQSGKRDESVADQLARSHFTIVGVVESPLYIDMTSRGTTDIGNGTIHYFVYLPQENFKADYYTELYLSYAPARVEKAYTTGYDDAVVELREKIETLQPVRIEARYRQLQTEGQKKLDDARREIDDAIDEMNTALADARAQLGDAEQQLADGIVEYEDGKRKFAEEIEKAAQELEDARLSLEEGWQQYRDGRDSYMEGHQELARARRQLDEAQKQYQRLTESVVLFSRAIRSLPDNIPAALPEVQRLVAALNQSFTDPNGTSLGLGNLLIGEIFPQPDGDESDPPEPVRMVTAQSKAAAVAALDAYQAGVKEQLDLAEADYAEGRRKLSNAAQELSEARRELEAGREEYQNGLEEFEEEKQRGQRELDDARAELEDARREIAGGWEDYQTEKTRAEREIADAEAEWEDARRELNRLEPPKWYLQTRAQSNPNYANFGDDADRIDRVAAIFPVFFLLVAALVCLTTVTRMVEEQRTQIGIVKALGYGNGAIASKYLVYAVAAGLAGSAVGLVIGFWLFPTVIYNAYRILYDMPPAITPFWWGFGLLACAAAAACTALAALAACWAELTGNPASIMRPRAPKSGKRVLLERIPPLWNRISFIGKVTLRNLFRYKKRVLMTVAGIAGCTALILTGFGLNDAIADIVRKQFGEIFTYDLMIFYDADSPAAQRDIRDAVEQNPNIASALSQSQQNITAVGSSRQVDAYLVVPKQPEALPSYLALRDRLSAEPVPFPETGAVLTEKLAKLLGVSPGDTILLRDSDQNEHPVTVAALTEHYAHHYIYLSPSYYEQQFGEPPTYQSYLALLVDPSVQNQVSSDLLAVDGVLMVSSTAQARNDFGNINENFKYVVAVLIVSAGLLAFVVLYNLTNINITERTREIATLKVLGFYDGETAAYLYRENIFLTLLGILAGLLLGIALNRFVILTAEIDAIMFGREIKPLSFVLAAALTFLFSALVNLAMYFKLKRINMVESMKSVD